MTLPHGSSSEGDASRDFPKRASRKISVAPQTVTESDDGRSLRS